MADQYQFKDLTFKEKVGYIWDYYRYQIFIALLIIYLVGCLVSFMLSKSVVILSNVTFYDLRINESLMGDMADELTDALTDDPKNEKVDITVMNATPNNTEAITAQVQQFFGMLAGGYVDIVITHEESFNSFAGEGFLTRLDEFLGEERCEALGEMLVCRVYTDEDGESVEVPFGIALDGNHFLEKYDIEPEQLFLSVVYQEEMAENSRRVIDYMILDNR